MGDIVKNIQIVKERMRLACIEHNRQPEDVKLLLATKTVSPENIKIALSTGETLIAENKIQEVQQKYEALKDTPHTAHFIGHLQSNKVKYIIKYGITCIQSVDRMSLVEKLHQRLQSEGKKMDILVQVNTSNEASKFGISPKESYDFIKYIADLETINIKGLMTIGLFSSDVQKVRDCFKRLKEIQQNVIAKNMSNTPMKELSMGMSNDLEVAIAEGSTIIRVGTAIFGQRIYPDSYYWKE